MAALRALAIVLLLAGIAAGLHLLGRLARRRLERVEAAWRTLASARGYQLEPHRGWFWWHPGLGSPPRLRGLVSGVMVEAWLAGHRDLTDTVVRAALVAPPAARPPAGTRVRPELLDPEAAALWARIQRPAAGMTVEPGTDGRVWFVLGWRTPEADPEMLQTAMDLVATCARRPPAPGSTGAASMRGHPAIR